MENTDRARGCEQRESLYRKIVKNGRCYGVAGAYLNIKVFLVSNRI